MESSTVSTVEDVTLARRGFYVTGTLILAPHHLVFSFIPTTANKPVDNTKAPTPREIWICYPIIERISKARGSSWINANNGNQDATPPPFLRNTTPPKESNDGASAVNSHMLSLTGNLQSNAEKTSEETNVDMAELQPALTPRKQEGSGLHRKYHHHGHHHNSNGSGFTSSFGSSKMDHYSASHIRIQCKDFTYYSFDFANDGICTDVFQKLSALITLPKAKSDILKFYAFSYNPNKLESGLSPKGWDLYNAEKEYSRLGLTATSGNKSKGLNDNEINESNEPEGFWRISNINDNYSFCPSYPRMFVVPSTISDNVLKHAGKFRSKQRIPVVVYRHKSSINGNVIARCAQPLVGLKLQNRSLQDEKLIGEIFQSQEREKGHRVKVLEEGEEDEGANETGYNEQPQRNLIIDLRPIANAMAQHALGAGTESIDNYRGRAVGGGNESPDLNSRLVDKIFCNIDNIHVMRDSLNKLTTILNDLDKYPLQNQDGSSNQGFPLLQQSLTKTQWLHRLSIILQSVDRITKSVHLNNTNVVIHCSDGWDRTSQVSALLQLCLDPYYRTFEGFMTLVEKEWVSFGFKFAMRSDHGGCIGAKYSNINSNLSKKQQTDVDTQDSEAPQSQSQILQQLQAVTSQLSSNGAKVASFLQRAATHIKNTAVSASNQASEIDIEDGKLSFSGSSYNGSSEKSPIFHQFLDCVYQLYRQHPSKFEFNSRFLKRLFYHHYSCQYGTFLCNSERELEEIHKLQNSTVSVWDYFNSRTAEFTNPTYVKNVNEEDDGVLFFNFTDIKWWFELYGRSDEEMNGLSNSLDRKFANMKLNR